MHVSVSRIGAEVHMQRPVNWALIQGSSSDNCPFQGVRLPFVNARSNVYLRYVSGSVLSWSTDGSFFIVFMTTPFPFSLDQINGFLVNEIANVRISCGQAISHSRGQEGSQRKAFLAASCARCGPGTSYRARVTPTKRLACM